MAEKNMSFKSDSTLAIITFVTGLIFQSSRTGNDKASLALAQDHSQKRVGETRHPLSKQTHTCLVCKKHTIA